MMKAQIKQVIVMRRDLKMRRGKEIAQGAHASMSFLTRNIVQSPMLVSGIVLTNVQKEWLNSSFRKITLQVDSEQELDDIVAKAKELGVECHLIIDEGLTEFNNVPTKTCLALGPDYDTVIDPLTKHLK